MDAGWGCVAILIFMVLGTIGGIGYRIGWNAACRLYRDRTVDRAEKQYNEDTK